MVSINIHTKGHLEYEYFWKLSSYQVLFGKQLSTDTSKETQEIKEICVCIPREEARIKSPIQGKSIKSKPTMLWWPDQGVKELQDYSTLPSSVNPAISNSKRILVRHQSAEIQSCGGTEPWDRRSRPGARVRSKLIQTPQVSQWDKQE